MTFDPLDIALFTPQSSGGDFFQEFCDDFFGVGGDVVGEFELGFDYSVGDDAVVVAGEGGRAG